MSSEETTDVKARSAIQALGELFSDSKLRSHSYHRYVLVQRNGEWLFEQVETDFQLEQAIAEAFGEPKPRRRIIRMPL